MTTALLQAGVTYGGRYAVRRKLSRGAQPRTWLVEDLRDGCERVVRLHVAPGLTPSEWARLDGATRQQRIDAHLSQLEAGAAVWRVDSPYVAQIVRVEASAFLSDAFHPPAPVPALVLEYHPGAVPLDTLTATWEEVVLGVLARLAEALAAVHRTHMAHGGLCPDSVLVVADEEGAMRPLLVGFGPLSDGAGSLTGGPAAYAPPEADSGNEPDAAWDVWSFGVLICRSLTGRLPYHLEAARAEGRDAGGRPRVLSRDHLDLSMLTGDAREIAEACLSFEPAARPSMVGIGARIRRLLGEQVSEVLLSSASEAPDTLVDGFPGHGGVDATAAMPAFVPEPEPLTNDELEAMLPPEGEGLSVDAFAMTMEAPAVTDEVLRQLQAQMSATGAQSVVLERPGTAEPVTSSAGAELPQPLQTLAPPSERPFAADPRTYSDRELDLPLNSQQAAQPHPGRGSRRATGANAVERSTEASIQRAALVGVVVIAVIGWMLWSYLGAGGTRPAPAAEPPDAAVEEETVYEEVDRVLERAEPETIVIDTGLRTPLPPTRFGNARDENAAASPVEEAAAPGDGVVDFPWAIHAELQALACNGRAVVVEKTGGQQWLRLPCRIECKLDTDDAQQPTALTGCSDWRTVRAEPGPIPLGCSAPAIGAESRTCLGEGAFRLTETGESVKTMVKLELSKPTP